MAIESATTLKTHFETGDVPVQSQYEALIDTMVARKAVSITADGVTDDTAALDAAIVTGGKIRLPEGTISCTGVSLDSDVFIQGEGPATVVQQRSTAANHVLGLTGVTGKTNLHISDLVIDGNKALGAFTAGGHGLDIRGFDTVRIDRVEVKNCWGHGLNFQNCQKIIIGTLVTHDNDKFGCVFGSALGDGTYVSEVIIGHLHAYDNGWSGLDFNDYDATGTHKNVIIGSVISHGNGLSGIAFGRNALPTKSLGGGYRISFNTLVSFENTDHGIEIYGSNECQGNLIVCYENGKDGCNITQGDLGVLIGNGNVASLSGANAIIPVTGGAGQPFQAGDSVFLDGTANYNNDPAETYYTLQAGTSSTQIVIPWAAPPGPGAFVAETFGADDSVQSPTPVVSRNISIGRIVTHHNDWHGTLITVSERLQIGQILTYNNNQTGGASNYAGLSVYSGTRRPDGSAVNGEHFVEPNWSTGDIHIGSVMAYDDQASPTQRYGLDIQSGAQWKRRLRIDYLRTFGNNYAGGGGTPYGLRYPQEATEQNYYIDIGRADLSDTNPISRLYTTNIDGAGSTVSTLRIGGKWLMRGQTTDATARGLGRILLPTNTTWLVTADVVSMATVTTGRSLHRIAAIVSNNAGSTVAYPAVTDNQKFLTASTPHYATRIYSQAKVGSVAGWVVGGTTDNPTITLPAGQTGATLVIPLDGILYGRTISAFAVIGQVESAGNNVTITANLRRTTTAAADLTDASVSTTGAQVFSADTALSAANLGMTGLTESAGLDERFYVLITATTTAATDIALQGVSITTDEIAGRLVEAAADTVMNASITTGAAPYFSVAVTGNSINPTNWQALVECVQVGAETVDLGA